MNDGTGAPIVPRDAKARPVAQFAEWHELVERIHAGDAGAMEALYAIFSRGIRFYLCRQLGVQEVEDKVHDTFLIVVQAIRRGELREPDRPDGFRPHRRPPPSCRIY